MNFKISLNLVYPQLLITLNNLSKNIRILRTHLRLTQAEMQAHTGVSGATWSNYEKGQTEPDIATLLVIATFFKIPVGELIQGNFEKGNLISKYWGEKKQVKRNPISKATGNLNSEIAENTAIFELPGNQAQAGKFQFQAPKIITVDTLGNENVLMVPVKARAGYLTGYSDPEFVSSLPAYRLPGLNNGTFRLFEVEGLSMYPTLHSGDLVIASNVGQAKDLRDDRVYVVVTKNDGVVVKRVLNRLATDNKLILKSDNYKDRDMYPTIVVDPEDILEIWYATGLISRQMRPPAEMYNRLIDLEGRLTLLESISKRNP